MVVYPDLLWLWAVHPDPIMVLVAVWNQWDGKEAIAKWSKLGPSRAIAMIQMVVGRDTETRGQTTAICNLSVLGRGPVSAEQWSSSAAACFPRSGWQHGDHSLRWRGKCKTPGVVKWCRRRQRWFVQRSYTKRHSLAPIMHNQAIRHSLWYNRFWLYTAQNTQAYSIDASSTMDWASWCERVHNTHHSLTTTSLSPRVTKPVLGSRDIKWIDDDIVVPRPSNTLPYQNVSFQFI